MTLLLLLMSYFGMRLRKNNSKTSMELQKTESALDIVDNAAADEL
jgi:hypothetical protein